MSPWLVRKVAVSVLVMAESWHGPGAARGRPFHDGVA
jgi:hypothetical protein